MFGVLALGYTAAVIGVALFFWQSRVSGMLDHMGGWIFWLFVALIAVIIGIPVALGVGVLGYRTAQHGRRFLYRRVLAGRPVNQVTGLSLLALLLAVPAWYLGEIYAAAAGSLVLVIGLQLSLRLAPWYLGSQLQTLFLALPWLLGLLLIAQVLSPLSGPASAAADVLARGVVPATMLLGTFVLFTTIISFTHTSLQGGWALLVAGMALLVIGGLVALLTAGDMGETWVRGVSLAGYGAFAAGLFRIHHRLHTLRPEQVVTDMPEATSDTQRLSSAIRYLVDGSLEQFVQIYGRRALRKLEEQFNAASAATAGWNFFITEGRFTDSGQGSLLERSQTYAAALSDLFAVKARIAGRRFVEGQLSGLYRLMPWEEREIGDEYLFSRLDWMGDTPRTLAATRSRILSLLRSAPLFAGLGEEELKTISDRLTSEEHPGGSDIIVQGEPGNKFYLVESGTVEVWVKQEDGAETMEATLGRGDYFGERALLNDAPRAATCRCKTRVRVLSLDREEFELLVSRRFQIKAELDEVMERAELLMAMPLFSEVGAPQMKILASALVSESHGAGKTVIRQGDQGDSFYVVKSGAVEVRRRAEGTDEESTVGHLGEGEYFGEIALLMNVPRTASVTAVSDVELLSLDRASFEEMVRDHLQSSRSLEQVSSRRLIQLRRAETLGHRAEP